MTDCVHFFNVSLLKSNYLNQSCGHRYCVLYHCIKHAIYFRILFMFIYSFLKVSGSFVNLFIFLLWMWNLLFMFWLILEVFVTLIIWNENNLFIANHFNLIFCVVFPFSPIYIHIYQSLRSGRIWHKVNFLSGVWQVWIQSFPSPRLVTSPRLKNLVCLTILPIAGGRIIGFIPFPRVLVQCEMQLVSSRIWTRVAVSISYDDNHYLYISSHTPMPWKMTACMNLVFYWVLAFNKL